MLESFCKILKKYIKYTTASNFSPLTQLTICLNDQNVESCLFDHATNETFYIYYETCIKPNVYFT